MQYSIFINQLFIASDDRFKMLDLNDVAIFECVRKLITGMWGKKELEGNILWAHVPVKKISEQLPLLRDGNGKPWKPDTIYRRVCKLCDCGLLLRNEANKRKGMAFLGLAPLADNYDFFKKPTDVDPMVVDPPTDINPMPYGCKSDGTTDVNPMYNNISIIPSVITSETPDSQANGVAVAPKKRRVKSKLRITTDEAILHYETELKNLAPIPQDSSSAAAAPREKKLAYGYKLLYEWMRDGDAEIPNGMKDTVMHMGEQLTFKQLCILADGEKKLTMYQIKHYLTRMHTFTENKNLSIYLTICKWFNDDVKLGKVPPKQPVANGQQQQPKTGMSVPKEVTQ